MAELSTKEKEISKLKKLFKSVPKDTMKLILPLIENAAFMTEQLAILQETISKNGVISEYKNGENQYGTKKSPEVEVYNTMIKNYCTVIKQLAEFLPDDSPEKDELTMFIQARRK